MRSRLWVKFAALLLFIAAVAMSSSIILRTFIMEEFKKYHEGEMEDRVYWVTADLEGAYEKYGSWNGEVIAEDTVWALMLGMETRIVDADGKVVMDSARALDTLPPLSKARVRGVTGIDRLEPDGSFLPYPLFLGGREIGRLEVRFLPFGKEELFIQRSNRFLLVSSLLTGGLTLVLSMLFASRLTGPIRKLVVAAEAIGQGNLKSRVEVRGKDEIARLSKSFNRMVQTLEIQESLRKKLCANAAHELRTPLAAIRCELEGMMDGLIPATREQLQSLHDETGRLTRIISGMEELIQAEASILTLKKQNIRLKPFLAAIAERYSTLFQNEGVKFRLLCKEEIMVAADPDRLAQIMVNLLGNAMKATEGGGTITVPFGRHVLAA